MVAKKSFRDSYVPAARWGDLSFARYLAVLRAVSAQTCSRSVKRLDGLLGPMSEAQPVSVEPGIARDLTAFQQNILVILAEEARYGLAIKRELESYYDSEVNHGRLYPNLDDLVEMGLVEKSQLDKRTNQYALTEVGEEAVLDQLGWVFSKFITDDSRADDLRERMDSVQ
jgi:DNA-binding PadR family transcriptional regulator